MNIHERIRSDRGGSHYTYVASGGLVPPLIRSTAALHTGHYADRMRTLKNARHCSCTTHKVVEPIPEDDLRILEKIYHKEYEDCGRKRGALLRYIKHYRESVEPVNHSQRLFKHINKLVRKSQS
jgi:hypothetical protein